MVGEQHAGKERPEQHLEIKEIDRAILSVLLENSRLSYRQIAKRVKLSVATVMYHVQHLERQGVIKGYSAQLDYEKLGYDLSVIIDVRVVKGKLVQVEKKLSMHPNVAAVYDNTGHFDVTVIARFKSTRLMDNFLKLIQSYEFVERTETKLILRTMKEKEINP